MVTYTVYLYGLSQREYNAITLLVLADIKLQFKMFEFDEENATTVATLSYRSTLDEKFFQADVTRAFGGVISGFKRSNMHIQKTL